MSVNKIILIGHLGKDPEVRPLEGGVKVASFTLATTEKGYTLQNGTQVPDRTEWHNIIAWRGLAETVEKYVKKGDKLYVEGKVRYRSYEDKDKVKRYITEVFVDSLELLTPKPQHQQVPPPQPVAQYQGAPQQQYQQPQPQYQPQPQQQYQPQQYQPQYQQPVQQPQQGGFPPRVNEQGLPF